MRINYYPPRGDNKEGWDNIDIFGWLGYPMEMKVDFLCRDSVPAAPLVFDLVLFLDLAKRAGMRGIQGRLSFYFKSPQCALKTIWNIKTRAVAQMMPNLSHIEAPSQITNSMNGCGASLVAAELPAVVG